MVRWGRQTSGVTTQKEVEHSNSNNAPLLLFVRRCSAARYGQLCPLLAKMYYHYGHALLRIAESKADALGGPAAEEGEEEDDDEEGGGAGAGEAPKEEDLGEEGGAAAEDADDVQVAYENLDVARVIYSKMEPTQVSGVASARWRL